MKPHEIVKQQIEDLYLQISTIRLGEVCIYPDLARHLDQIQVEVQKLFNESLTIDPDSILG